MENLLYFLCVSARVGEYKKRQVKKLLKPELGLNIKKDKNSEVQILRKYISEFVRDQFLWLYYLVF